MDIDEIFKKTDTDIGKMLSEMIETQCGIKALLTTVLSELSNGDGLKEQELFGIAEKLKNQELLRVVAKFSSQNTK